MRVQSEKMMYSESVPSWPGDFCVLRELMTSVTSSVKKYGSFLCFD